MLEQTILTLIGLMFSGLLAGTCLAPMLRTSAPPLCANCGKEEAVRGRFCSNFCAESYYCDDFRDEPEEDKEA